MNIMLLCPMGDIFLGSIDTIGNKKTKVYIATELKKFIDAVGLRFMTQICTNNATNMLGAMDDIVASYPHIFKQGCDAHVLDLMLEDWAKIDQFEDLINKAKRIFIYRTTMWPWHSFGSTLLEIFDSIGRIMICLPILHDKSNAWGWECFGTSDHPSTVNNSSTCGALFHRQNGHHVHALVSLVRATLLEGNLWHHCQDYVHMVEDVWKALQVFNGQEAAMGKVWLTVNNLKKHNFNLQNPHFNLPGCIAVTLEENFTKRWDMMVTDLY